MPAHCAGFVVCATGRDRFRAMLTRIQLTVGSVAFLLIDPSSGGSRKLADFRQQGRDVYTDC